MTRQYKDVFIKDLKIKDSHFKLLVLPQSHQNRFYTRGTLRGKDITISLNSYTLG